MSVPQPQTGKKGNTGFNPIDLGKKIYEVWENDPMLGIVTTPFGLAFGIWFFTMSNSVGYVLLYLSIAVGLVSIASSIKHVYITDKHAKYGLKAREQTVIEIETDTIRNKEIAETEFQMEIAMILAKQSGFSSDSLLRRAIEYLRQGNADPDVLKLFADSISDIRDSLNDQMEKIKLPFKEYIEKLFRGDEEEDDVDRDMVPKPSELEVNKQEITPEMIRKEAERITSHNPTSDDLKEISEELGYTT